MKLTTLVVGLMPTAILASVIKYTNNTAPILVQHTGNGTLGFTRTHPTFKNYPIPKGQTKHDSYALRCNVQKPDMTRDRLQAHVGACIDHLTHLGQKGTMCEARIGRTAYLCAYKHIRISGRVWSTSGLKATHVEYNCGLVANALALLADTCQTQGGSVGVTPQGDRGKEAYDMVIHLTYKLWI